TEIGMISALQHPNLMKLYGFCVEGNHLMLIYEFMANNCVSRALFNKLSSIQRTSASFSSCFRYLIIYKWQCDNKTATRASFDSDHNLVTCLYCNECSLNTCSCRGYMAPEYAMRGYLTAKADVYSYGVVALEIVSGKNNTNYRPKEECVYLLDEAYVLQERGSLLELVDPDLGPNIHQKRQLSC
ncbi:unnamed protein product, partial [Coffea canephora]